MRIQFKTGKHNPRLRGKLYSYTCSFYQKTRVMFTSRSEYNIGKKEQSDWLKLYGRKSWFPFGKWRKEEFWVCRYNIEDDYYEITKYYRDGKVFRWDKDLIITKKMEPVVLNNDWFTLSLPAGSYFGGNIPASNYVEWILKNLNQRF